VEIQPASAGEGERVAEARVARMSRVGFMIKIELSLDDGQPLSVELTRDRVAELGIGEGDRVFVNLREARIFVQDYAI
jgi:sulfate/thiosulfate transport system ATP-binding protein